MSCPGPKEHTQLATGKRYRPKTTQPDSEDTSAAARELAREVGGAIDRTHAPLLCPVLPCFALPCFVVAALP